MILTSFLVHRWSHEFSDEDEKMETYLTEIRRTVDAMSAARYELPRYDTRDLPPFTAAVPHA